MNKHQILKEIPNFQTQILNEHQSIKECQISKQMDITKEPQIMNEPQNFKDHQISRRTQITNEP